MGEIADMMLDGTLCSSCGSFLEENFDLEADVIEDTSPGFPMMCASCSAEEAPPRKKRNRRGRRFAKVIEE